MSFDKLVKKEVEGAGGGGGCFIAGTRVSTPDGPKPIESVSVGDQVYSFKPDGSLEVSKVVDTFKHEPQAALRVQCWGQSIQGITPNHWVLNQYNTFAEIQHFTPNDALTTEAGHLVPVIDAEYIGEYEVYNLTVEPNHTYIADGIRAHNSGRGDVSGSGGGGGGGKGGGGGGGANAIEEAPNTLRSKATARVQDLVSEGEIVGLVNGLSSVFLENTPVVQPGSGQRNFEGVRVLERVGSPDQDEVPGFPFAESEVAVGVEVRYGTPINRQISDPAADAARVTVRIPALFKQDRKSGDLEFYQVQYGIDVAPSGGFFQREVTDVVDGKTVNPYERAYRVPLPVNGDPWTIRVVRDSRDDTAAHLNSTTIFARYTEIIDNKFTYPDSAYYSLEVDAQQFGGRIPRRAYEIDGIKVNVPSNYDPATRDYSGTWDGTFKIAHTDNPAWVFYDLIINDRYGLGQWIDPAQVDKFELYAIAQYCDAVDSDGNFVGVDDGKGGVEPRFTYNGVINTREESFNVVQAVASAFRGMAFWSTGAITAAQDRPEDPVILVSRANVLDGEFQYSGTAFKARHSAVRVTWNNPENAYRAEVEAVEDPELIERFGYRPKDTHLPGCTSQGMANRYARWILETEKSEQEIVTYKASLDHMVADGTAVLPGDIIMINDPTLAGVRFGGRIAGVNGTDDAITLDSEVILESGENYDLNVVLPDGTVETKNVTTATGQTVTQLELDSALSQTPLVNAMWVLTATNVSPTKWRVQAIRESDKNVVEVTAVEHDPTKYARVEQGIQLERPQYSTVPSGPLTNPNSITGRTTLRETDQGTLENVLVVSWETSEDPRVNQYELQVAEPGQGFESGFVQQETSFTKSIRRPGLYRFRVRSLSNQSKAPSFTTGDLEVDGLTDKKKQIGPPQGLELFNGKNKTVFNNLDAKFRWRRPVQVRADNRNPFNGPQGTDTFQDDPQLKDYNIRIKDSTGTLIREEFVKEESYDYTYDKNIDDGGPYRNFTVEVRARRRNGVLSFKPAKLSVTNPVPELPQNLSIEGGIGQIFVSFDRPNIADFEGAKIWAEASSGFDPNTTDPVVDASGNSFVLDVAQDTTYYVRVALFDTFGKQTDNLNISSEINTQTKGAVSTEVPNFSFDGIRFKPNDPSTNEVSWTSGTAHVTDGNGNTSSYNISSGSVAYSSGVIYIYYKQGDTSLSTSTNIQDATSVDQIIIATYEGGTDLKVGNGDAFMDGSRILAQTIGSAQLVTGQAVITGTAQIANAIITNAKIDNVAVDKLTAGNFDESMDVGQAEIVIDGTQSVISVSDQQATPVTRVEIGKLGANADDYGITVRDKSGNITLNSGAVEPSQIDALQLTNGPNESGADVTANNTADSIFGQGSFATLSQIDASNISTYINTAAIGTAYIEDLAVETIKIANAATFDFVYSSAPAVLVDDGNSTWGSTTVSGDGYTNPRNVNAYKIGEVTYTTPSSSDQLPTLIRGTAFWKQGFENIALNDYDNTYGRAWVEIRDGSGNIVKGVEYSPQLFYYQQNYRYLVENQVQGVPLTISESAAITTNKDYVLSLWVLRIRENGNVGWDWPINQPSLKIEAYKK